MEQVDRQAHDPSWPLSPSVADKERKPANRRDLGNPCQAIENAALSGWTAKKFRQLAPTLNHTGAFGVARSAYARTRHCFQGSYVLGRGFHLHC